MILRYIVGSVLLFIPFAVVSWFMAQDLGWWGPVLIWLTTFAGVACVVGGVWLVAGGF